MINKKKMLNSKCNKVEDMKEDIIFYYLAKDVQNNEGYHCTMPNVIFGHDGIDSEYPVFYPFDKDELEDALDYFDGNYDEYNKIFVFNNAPVIVDLYQQVKSNYIGVDVRLINMNSQLFGDYHIDCNKAVNGYLA